MAPFSVPMTFGTQQVAIGDTGGDAAMCVPAALAPARLRPRERPLRQRRHGAPRSSALTPAPRSSYSPQYYLVGQPLFSQYPSTFTPQTTVAFTLVGTNATALPTVTVPAVRCRNYQRSEDCGKKCTRYYYYRVISVLVSVTLQVTLPAACATGPCAAASLVTDGCSGTYTEQPSMLITESDYRADGGNCRNLPSNSLISQPGVQPLLSVRSSADPRVAAAQLTGCSYQFGPTAKELHKTGAGLIAGASVIMCLGCGCCFVAFDKGSDQPAAAPADGAVAEVVVHTEPAQQPYDESGQPQQPQAVYVVYEQPQQPVYVVPPLAPLPPPLAPLPPPLAPLPPLSPAAGPAGGRGRGRGRAPVAAHGGGRGRGATHVQAAPPPVAYDKSQY